MKNKITQEDINNILEKTHWTVEEFHGKCTVVVAKLPNGFILTESSACVDPANYDVKIGIECCKERIVNKIWNLEGYRLQCELYELKQKGTI
ncbi:Gp49 family protein [Bacillus mycoides]|uniref:Gp49 family protein n=1 Tax=Bacillus mycoides TaxID=1405 RepID=UPI00355739BF